MLISLVSEDEVTMSQNGDKYSAEEWHERNFLMDCPGKWEYSFYVEHDNSVCGFIIGTLDKEGNVHINRFLINKNYQGKGFGKELLYHLEKKAQINGIKEINLFVNVNNLHSIQFYELNGFKMIVGVELEKKLKATCRTGFLNDKVLDAKNNSFLYYMKKELKEIK